VRSVSSAAADDASWIAVSKPAATRVGDLLVALVAHQGGDARTMSAPRGWTAIPKTDVSEGNNAGLHVWYKVADGFEPSSYRFELHGGSGEALAGGLVAVAEADTESPILAAASQSNGTAVREVPAPLVGTTKPGMLLVYAGAANVQGTFAPPPGMSEHVDLAAGGTYKIALEVAAQAGAQRTATSGPSALLSTTGSSVAVVIAVAPRLRRR
jgi:hypothetical protein